MQGGWALAAFIVTTLVAFVLPGPFLAPEGAGAAPAATPSPCPTATPIPEPQNWPENATGAAVLGGGSPAVKLAQGFRLPGDRGSLSITVRLKRRGELLGRVWMEVWQAHWDGRQWLPMGSLEKMPLSELAVGSVGTEFGEYTFTGSPSLKAVTPYFLVLSAEFGNTAPGNAGLYLATTTGRSYAWRLSVQASTTDSDYYPGGEAMYHDGQGWLRSSPQRATDWVFKIEPL